MIIDVADLAISLVEADDRICAHVLDGTGFEPQSLVTWARMVRAGKVALDVGAYTGLYSIIAAKRGATAIAFEPMPAQQWRIGVNAQANKAQVNLMGCAVSDRNGTATLYHNSRVPLTSGASLEKGVKFHRDSLEVSCIAIDTLALPTVAAIKIDVERHEPSVLRGAALTIARDRPVLLVETLDDAMRGQVLSLLPDYEVADVLDGRNTLFTPKERPPCRKEHSPGPLG